MTYRFLITGGAGFLGINLIRFLLARGHAVSSLDVAGFRYPDVADRVQVIQGDIRAPGVVDRAMEGVDIVVHAAAALPLDPREDIFTTNVDGTRNVLEAGERRGIGRLIHISSTAVYGIPDHHPLVEGDRLQGVGPYGEAKVQAEAICHEYRRRGMCLPMLRPKSFVGPERLGVFALLYEWASEGKHFPISQRSQSLSASGRHGSLPCSRSGCGRAEEQSMMCSTLAPCIQHRREEFQACWTRPGTAACDHDSRRTRAGGASRPGAAAHVSALPVDYDTVASDSFVSVERPSGVGVRTALLLC